MGTVYKAHDRTLDETVALKVMRSDLVRQQDLIRRFRSEIKLARKVRHPNVCAIHEYGEDAGLHFIAMEFVDGTDLRRFLREGGRLSPEEAFDVAVQIAQGLRAMHLAGIIHRDLKTPNIMRDSSGRVRLMDFGIAKQSGSDTTLGGQVVGTPEYMSPEQARGHKVDFRSDVYALGIVLFEIFTGRLPFHGDTPIATILKQINEPPPLEGPAAVGIPPALTPVLRKALAKEPPDRFASGAEMLEALIAARDANLREGRPASPRAPGARTRPGRAGAKAPSPPSRQTRRWAWLAAAAVAAGAVYVAWPRGPQEAPGPSAAGTPPPALASPPSSPAEPAATSAPSPSPAPTSDQPTARGASPAPRAVPSPTAAPDGRRPPAPLPRETVTAPPTIPTPEPPPPAPTPSLRPPDVNPPLSVNPPRTAPESRPAVRRGDLVEAGPGVAPPVLVSAAEPAYPPLAARLRRQARVVVRVLVDEDGGVARAEVVSGDKSNLGFNEAALAAARKSTFRPAQKDGVPVKMWSEMPFSFSPN
jgi:serine/threonine-protein kinase